MSPITIAEETVLVVEDSPSDAALVAAALTAAGRRSVHAGCIADAQSVLAEREFACVLLDLSLPDADELEGLYALTSAGVHPPIVVLSGRSDERLALRALESGAQDYLTKDTLDPSALERAVGYAVRRKRLESQLESSERRFRGIVESARDALVSVDGDGIVTGWNDQAERMLGWSGDEIVGRPASRVFTPDGIEACRAAGRASAGTAGDTRGHVDVHAVHAAGRLVPVEVAVSGPSGDGVDIHLFLRDTAERTARERRLAQQAEHEAAIAEIGTAALRGLDVDELTAMAAGAAARVLDVPFAKACRLDREDVLRAEAGVGWSNGFVGSATLATEPGSYARFILDAPGVVHSSDLRIDPRFAVPEALVELGALSSLSVAVRANGSVYGTLAAHAAEPRDFTYDEANFLQAVANVLASAIKRADDEHALRRSEERYREIIQTTSEGVWQLDAAGRTVFVNERMAAMLGVGVAAMAGAPMSDFVHPDSAAQLRQHLERCRSGVRGTADIRFSRADGAEIWALLSTNPLYGDDGEYTGALAMCPDITERVRAEEENGALQEALSRAQRLDTVGQLAGGVAHDFNNLLSVILNYAAFVAGELPEGSELRTDVGEITRAAERAAALTRQLLVFSRQETPQVHHVDLHEKVTETQNLLRRTLGEQIALSVDLTAETPIVLADPVQVEQLLMNLAINARDAMPDGGRLDIRTAPVHVGGEHDALPACTLPDGEYIEVSVSDSGCGMAPAVLERAFEPFFTTKARGEGTGLGLATVWGVARQAGGDVAIETEPDAGTTVRVYLPSAAAAPEAEDPGGSDEEPQARTGQVLVVEDEEPVRRLTVRILAGAGYTVAEAAAPEEALRLCAEEGPFDLLVTDVVMPRMSGPEVAAALAGRGVRLPVVYMSGYAEYRARLPEEAVLVRKPFDATQLLQAADTAVRGSAA